MMFLKKIMTTTTVVLALGMAVITGGSMVVGQTEGKPAVGKDAKASVAEKPVEPAAKQEKEKSQEGEKPSPKDLSKIEPPGGVPMPLVEPGTKKIGVDQLNKVRDRLRSVPEKDLEQWVVELERIIEMKLKNSPRQACRTDFVIRMSVAFDDLKWNATVADKLYKRACTMQPAEAKSWKEAFESVLKKEIGIKETEKDEFSNQSGGPPWAVPLVLIPVDALHEGQKYSVERGKKYLARLKQLTKDDVALWRDKIDKFGGTELDAAVNIILLDDFFSKEQFQRDRFKAAVERQDDKKPAVEKPVEPAVEKEKDKELLTAWGKEVGGLQAGLSLLDGKKKIYSRGETVTLVVRVRNVGKEAVKFKYVKQFLDETRPTVTDAESKSIRQGGINMLGNPAATEVILEPGKEIVLETSMHGASGIPHILLPLGGSGIAATKSRPLHIGTGKFSLHYEQVIGKSSSLIELDPALSKLGTGTLELEVKEPTKGKQEKEKEPFTAWGKEVGGLQAGLGFKPGERRAYHHGEKVTLVVRVRNVGKESVTFGQGLVFWQLMNPISVTDSDGKSVYVQCLRPVGSFGQLGHQKTQLLPGKEVEYDQVTLQLKPAGTQEKQEPDNILFGSGKFRFEYRTDGFVTSSRSNNPPTGKLELEVKEALPERRKALTPEEAIKVAGDSKRAREFNESKSAVEFKVQFVTKAIFVKVSSEKDAAWVHGHSPDDVCLGLLVADDPLNRNQTRFVASLTGKVIGQLNKAGINDMEKHFKTKTVRVTGTISRHEYDGLGTPSEIVIVIDDLSQLEVVK